MRFFIILMMLTGCGYAYAAEDPISLPGIELKKGYVFRGIGPQEAAKVVVGQRIDPFRVLSGQFTIQEAQDFLKNLSPQKTIDMLILHQTSVDALDFPNNLSDAVIRGMFNETPEGLKLQKELLQSGKVTGGGFVISASENPAIAAGINSSSGYVGYGGPGGPVLIINKPYYPNPNPAFIREKEVFLDSISSRDIIGVAEGGKFYTLDEYRQIKGFNNKSPQQILSFLEKEAATRYALPENSPVRINVINNQLSLLEDIKANTSHPVRLIPLNPFENQIEGWLGRGSRFYFTPPSTINPLALPAPQVAQEAKVMPTQLSASKLYAIKLEEHVNAITKPYARPGPIPLETTRIPANATAEMFIRTPAAIQASTMLGVFGKIAGAVGLAVTGYDYFTENPRERALIQYMDAMREYEAVRGNSVAGTVGSRLNRAFVNVTINLGFDDIGDALTQGDFTANTARQIADGLLRLARDRDYGTAIIDRLANDIEFRRGLMEYGIDSNILPPMRPKPPAPTSADEGWDPFRRMSPTQ